MPFEIDEVMSRFVNQNRLQFVQQLPTELLMNGFPGLQASHRQKVQCRLTNEGPHAANSLLLDCIVMVENFSGKLICFLRKHQACSDLVNILQAELHRITPTRRPDASQANMSPGAAAGHQPVTKKYEANIPVNKTAQQPTAPPPTSSSFYLDSSELPQSVQQGHRNHLEGHGHSQMENLKVFVDTDDDAYQLPPNIVHPLPDVSSACPLPVTEGVAAGYNIAIMCEEDVLKHVRETSGAGTMEGNVGTINRKTASEGSTLQIKAVKSPAATSPDFATSNTVRNDPDDQQPQVKELVKVLAQDWGMAADGEAPDLRSSCDGALILDQDQEEIRYKGEGIRLEQGISRSEEEDGHPSSDGESNRKDERRGVEPWHWPEEGCVSNVSEEQNDAVTMSEGGAHASEDVANAPCENIVAQYSRDESDLSDSKEGDQNVTESDSEESSHNQTNDESASLGVAQREEPLTMRSGEAAGAVNHIEDGTEDLGTHNSTQDLGTSSSFRRIAGLSRGAAQTLYQGTLDFLRASSHYIYRDLFN